MRNTNRSGQSTEIYGADFETDRDDNHAWVCQWAMVKVSTRHKGVYNEVVYHGYDLQDFEAKVISLLDTQDKSLIYFHNFNFDVQFIRGFLHELSEMYEHRYIMRDGSPVILQFTNKETSGKIEFRDSMKKMPGDLKSMAKSVGMEKLDPPRENFEPGWSQSLTDADFSYVDNDARIVAVAMKQMHSKGFTHATVSGDAWAEMKATFNKTHKDEKIQWKEHYPKLDIKIDAEMRKGYFGGINISEHKGVTEGPLVHEDVHSMYPTVISYDPLPYGLPINTTKPDKYELYVMKGWFKFNLKDGMIPWFKFKFTNDSRIEGITCSDCVRHCDHWHEMTLTNIDIMNLCDFYDVEVDDSRPVTIWGFQSEIGANKAHIDKWYTEKNSKPKGTLDYQMAKLMMNSCYGRFGLNPEMDETSIVWDEQMQDYRFSASRITNEDTDAYIPYAMFVTAHARRRLLQGVLHAGCENVIHCDTDSVIHMGEPSDLGHTEALGDWDLESKPVRIYEGGFKRYVEVYREPVRSMKDINVTCAGVPQKFDKTGCPVGMWVEILDDFSLITRTGEALGHKAYHIKSEWLRNIYINTGHNPDCVNTMKLQKKNMTGGCYLAEMQFEMNDNRTSRFL